MNGGISTPTANHLAAHTPTRPTSQALGSVSGHGSPNMQLPASSTVLGGGSFAHAHGGAAQQQSSNVTIDDTATQRDQAALWAEARVVLGTILGVEA